LLLSVCRASAMASLDSSDSSKSRVRCTHLGNDLGDTLVAAASFLGGLSFNTLFVLPPEYEAVRLFFLAASNAFICSSVAGLLLKALAANDSHEFRALFKKWVSWMSWLVYNVSLSTFLLGLVFVLGGLMRYSIQAFSTTGEVLSLVATCSASLLIILTAVALGFCSWCIEWFKHMHDVDTADAKCC